MFQSHRIASWVVALGLAILVSGCAPQAPQEKAKPTATPEKAVQEKHVEAAPAGVSEGLAELSAEDRAVAEKQRIVELRWRQVRPKCK